MVVKNVHAQKIYRSRKSYMKSLRFPMGMGFSVTELLSWQIRVIRREPIERIKRQCYSRSGCCECIEIN